MHSFNKTSFFLKNLFLFIFLFSVFFAAAQSNIESSYNSTHVGQNVNLLFKRDLNNKKHSIYGGLKYHIGSSALLDNLRHLTYWKTFYPRNPAQSIGITIGYERNFTINEYVQGFAFYDWQYTKSRLRLRTDVGIQFRQDVTAIENNIGLGLKTKLSERLALIIRGGGGIMLIDDPTINFSRQLTILDIVVADTYEFCGLFTIGAQVSLSAKKRK